MSDPTVDPTSDPSSGPRDRGDLPDLEAVETTITEAHEAEDHLLDVMPAALPVNDDAYEGMSGATAGDVEETDDSQVTDDERQARSPKATPTEQVQDEVLDGDGDRDADRAGDRDALEGGTGDS